MENCSVFSYLDFKDYLSERFATHGHSRGMRHKFAKILQTGASHVTKVLSGHISLPLDHIPIINKLLEHTEDEAEFFFQLVIYTQAESHELKDLLKKKLDILLAKKMNKPAWIANMDDPPEEVKARYYSNWHYRVIRMITTIPEYQTKAAIADRLKLPLSTITDTLDYMEKVGLVEKINDRYKSTALRPHIRKDSPFFYQAHYHFKQLSIQKLLTGSPEDIRYSNVASMSVKNSEIFKQKIRKLFSEVEPLGLNTKNEDIFCFSVDFFRV